MTRAPTASLPPPGGGSGRGGALPTRTVAPIDAPACPSPGSAAPSPTSPRRGEVAELRNRAKAMRSAMSVPEAIVWKMLRAKHLNGWKFARQVVIGPYIADFAARRERLVVEIDGRSHDVSAAYDVRRDAVMAALGYQVLRFTNGDIATNLEGVSRAIDHELRLRVPADRNN